MKMNAAMRTFVDRPVNVAPLLSDALERLLERGLKEVGGAVLFAELHPQNKLPRPELIESNYVDLTGYEALENKFHVEDYCEGDILGQAMLFLDEFKKRWSTRFGKAVVIIDYDPTNELGATCTFRFHLERSGQMWLDESTLDEFCAPILVEHVH
ncbi:hypothetical protein [Lysobacter arvi]|uniref:Uncharacterized protein n=1 Tax=Lysobacter arvi TaxID=3038776 RepID=A0ABU1CE81_9GAMM|nr:hypothetical protein [Lysobacter arvi]MDR0183478.1 hypothetical protein [Lysobacter arvi]